MGREWIRDQLCEGPSSLTEQYKSTYREESQKLGVKSPLKAKMFAEWEYPILFVGNGFSPGLMRGIEGASGRNLRALHRQDPWFMNLQEKKKCPVQCVNLYPICIFPKRKILGSQLWPSTSARDSVRPKWNSGKIIAEILERGTCWVPFHSELNDLENSRITYKMCTCREDE